MLRAPSSPLAVHPSKMTSDANIQLPSAWVHPYVPHTPVLTYINTYANTQMNKPILKKLKRKEKFSE